MIWHAAEVLGLLATAFVVGCVIGANLHAAVRRTRPAPTQLARANAMGTSVDGVRQRASIGPVWRPQHPRYVEPGKSVKRIGLVEADVERGAESDPAVDTNPALPEKQDGIEVDLEEAPADIDASDSEPYALPAEPIDAARPLLRLNTEPAARQAPMLPAAGESAPPKPHDSLEMMRPACLAEPRNGVPDNLQRIRGIGERNEARLNQLGIYHFGQIAAWTPAEVRWIAQHLAFPERIDRDDWIGQAIVLASGGDTGFTKSADRRRERRQGLEAQPMAVDEEDRGEAP